MNRRENLQIALDGGGSLPRRIHQIIEDNNIFGLGSLVARNMLRTSQNGKCRFPGDENETASGGRDGIDYRLACRKRIGQCDPFPWSAERAYLHPSRRCRADRREQRYHRPAQRQPIPGSKRQWDRRELGNCGSCLKSREALSRVQLARMLPAADHFTSPTVRTAVSRFWVSFMGCTSIRSVTHR